MVALLICQLTITSYMLPTPIGLISLRLLLLVLTLLILAKAFILKEIDFGPGARKIIIPIIALGVIDLVANTFNGVSFDFIFKEFRNICVGLLVAVLLPAVINTPKQFRTLCIVSLVVVVASSIVGFLQHYNVLGMREISLIPGFVSRMGRVPGMGESELELSYVLPSAIMFLLAIYLNKGYNKDNGRFIILAMLIMLPALYFTYTRSALVSLVLGIICIILFIKWKKKWQIILVSSFLLIVILEATNVFGNTYLSGRSETGQEESSIARGILWQAALAIAIDNPIIGIGGDKFIEVSPQYVDRVDPALIKYEEDRYWKYRTLGTDAPHNDFLRIWAYYGSFALLAYIWIYLAMISNCAKAFRESKNRFIKGMALGVAGALVTYVVNAFYHNIGVTLPLLWILAGFTLATSKLTAKEKQIQS